MFLLITKLTFGQINNGGFEVWDTTFTGIYSVDLDSIFAVPNPKMGIVNSWVSGSPFGLTQTTDSYSGNYSMILHNWYSYAKEWITYRDIITSTPRYLQGYYKYITGGVDGLSHATAYVTATKFNGTTNDTIATGIYQFDSTATFTPFQLNISLTSLIPDSITIYIINANSNCLVNNVCNLLYLDNLTFSNLPLGIENSNLSEGVVNFYPNPFSIQTTFHTDKIFKDATLTVYNLYGQQVKQIKNISGQTVILSRDNLASGLYFLRLTEDNKTVSADKLVITD